MSKSLIPKHPIIDYPDYKKFVDFLENKYKITLENINPYEFFRTELLDSLDTPNLDKYLGKFFQGRFNPVPTFKNIDDGFNKHLKFEDFTSKDEVRNISLWGLSCLKNLSFDTSVRLGKELEIIQSENPRDGRLDVVGFAKKELLVLEAKTSLFSLLSEGRFKYQIPSYKNECLKIIKGHNRVNEDEINLSIFLFIGGEETDLYPPNHPDCTTGQVGNISKIFYDQLTKYEIKFVSANALWAMASMADILGLRLNWYDLLPELFGEDNTIGLLSGGKVIVQNNSYEVKPLNLKG